MLCSYWLRCKSRCGYNKNPFFSGGLLKNNDIGKAYLFSYKATRYLALPCLMADLYRGNDLLSTLHLFSGIIPFVMFLAGTEDMHLGNLVLALNIVSLCHYSFKHNRPWGWYTAGASIFAYFMSPQMGFKVMYPIGITLVGFCSFRLFRIHFEPGT